MRRGLKTVTKSSLDVDEFKKQLIEEEKDVLKENTILVKDENKIVKEERTIAQNLSKLKYHHQILFSLIIVVAVVLVWRGMWNLVDVYWFPGLDDFSNISSVVVGIIILIVTKKALNQLAGGLN